MTTTGNPIVAAVFETEEQAKQAMQDLQRAGFSNDQIRYSVHRGGTGITDSLVSLGLPQQEADFYNGQFEAGKTIVTVNTRDRQQEAYNILARDGGQSGNANFAQTAGNVTSTASNRVASNIDQEEAHIERQGDVNVGGDNVQDTSDQQQ